MKPPSPAKANNVRPKSISITTNLSSWDSDALGQYIFNQTTGVLRRLEELRPYYEELWKRFDKLPKGEKILDCRTRTEYCEKILNRSIRSVQHALYGRRSLNASVKALVDGLQSKQLIEKDHEREELEQEEEAKKRFAEDRQKYEKLKTKKDLTEQELQFVADHEWERYLDLTEWSNQGPNYRKHKKNLTAEELKFIQDYETRAAERRAKLAEEQLQEDIKRIREKAEREDREHFEFDPTGAVEDFFSSLRRKIVSPAVHAFLTEIVKEGFRQSATKHHPDKGGTQQQMQDLNEAHVILKKFVQSMKTTEKSERAA